MKKTQIARAAELVVLINEHVSDAISPHGIERLTQRLSFLLNESFAPTNDGGSSDETIDQSLYVRLNRLRNDLDSFMYTLRSLQVTGKK